MTRSMNVTEPRSHLRTRHPKRDLELDSGARRGARGLLRALMGRWAMPWVLRAVMGSLYMNFISCDEQKESSDHVTWPLQGVMGERTSCIALQIYINQTVIKCFYWPLL